MMHVNARQLNEPPMATATGISQMNHVADPEWTKLWIKRHLAMRQLKHKSTSGETEGK